MHLIFPSSMGCASSQHCPLPRTPEPGTPESRRTQGRATRPACVWRFCITQQAPGCSCHHSTQELPAPVLGPLYPSVNASCTQSLTPRASGQPPDIKGCFISVPCPNPCPGKQRFPRCHTRRALSGSLCFISGGECFVRGYTPCVPPWKLWVLWPSCLHP